MLGAASGNRTRTLKSAADFKSATSTSSVMAACLVAHFDHNLLAKCWQKRPSLPTPRGQNADDKFRIPRTIAKIHAHNRRKNTKIETNLSWLPDENVHITGDFKSPASTSSAMAARHSMIIPDRARAVKPARRPDAKAAPRGAPPLSGFRLSGCCGAQSPMDRPSARAARTTSPSGGTVLSLPATSESGTGTIWSPCSATM